MDTYLRYRLPTCLFFGKCYSLVHCRTSLANWQNDRHAFGRSWTSPRAK